MTTTPYTEQDIADMRDDLNRAKEDLQRVQDAMPLPGREEAWALGIAERMVRIDAMELEYDEAVALFVDFGDAA